MKPSELRQLTRDELQARLEQLTREEFELRMRRASQELPNPLRLRTLRRDLAQLKTLLREDELGIRELPKPKERRGGRKR
jgi:large subunit ribosomal protein L29